MTSISFCSKIITSKPIKSKFMILTPKPLYAKQLEIEQIANQFAKQHDFHFDNGLNSLVSKLGGKISYESSKFRLVAHDFNHFEIYPSAPLISSLSYERMDIAQTIGYYVLYFKEQNENGCFVCKRTTNFENRDEKQAFIETNWFANELLLPRKEFIECYFEFGAEKTAFTFDFPLQRIEQRAKACQLK